MKRRRLASWVQLVGDRLALDGPVEPLVLERDRGLRRQPVGELLGLVVEGAATRRIEEELPDCLVVGTEAERERPPALLGIPGAHELVPAAHEPRARGARGADRALEDDGQERLRVVRRGERLADQGDRLVHTPLVRLARSHVARPPPARGLLLRDRRLGRASAEEARDRPAEEERERHRRERREEGPPAGVVARRVDRGPRGERDQSDVRAFEERRRDEVVGLAVLLGLPGPLRRKRRARRESRGRGERAFAGRDGEDVRLEQTRGAREPACELLVDGDARDDAADHLAVVADDVHLATRDP